ncbi:hypothetical protein [Flavobacterium aestivum]|uniref:hypothetical protein n=1 Tax=Flavobacterium aestivum TaxID=3003257 RepID=UPI00248256E6|nr:hypothetical protein [Flavobacterium aestivum]
MIKRIIASVFLILTLLSCKNNNENNPKEVSDNQNNESFTVDCGSGCAMTYNEVSRKSNKSLVEIKYKVTQYINEKIEDEYFETYIFEGDENGNLSSIHLKNNKENILNDKSSLIRDKILEIGNKLYHKRVSNQPKPKETVLVSGKKPYKTMAVPFDLKNYTDNLPNEIGNSYSPTDKTKKYLTSIGYEGESYKCFFIKIDNSSTEIIVSVTRGESEYFLLLKANKDAFLSYKEIGSLGGEETRYFKIDENYNVVTY